MSIHVQCSLERQGEHQTTWLPKANAREGGVVDLRETLANGKHVWSRGWTVVKTWSELPTQVLKERKQLQKKHRAGSDV